MATMLEQATLSLHGAPAGQDAIKDGTRPGRSAILVRLNKEMMRDLQQSCHHGKVVQLLGGSSPRIRYGTKMLDLNVKPERFRYEIYSANKESNQGAALAALVGHEAHVKTAQDNKQQQQPEATTAGNDAALAALKQSLASMAKDKEARKATINLQSGNNAKAHPNHRQASSLLNHKRPGASSQARLDAPPTSTPQLDTQVKHQDKAMRTVVVHLLAVEPAREQDVASKTHIPKAQLAQLLPKIADKSASGVWELNSKAFRLIDPWTFGYQSQALRQTAIDNAIRAFDRSRLAKDDKVWQVLLPIEERGQGKTLSRLNMGFDRREQVGTPGLLNTPMHEGNERAGSVAATPKPAPSSTPRNGAVATGRSAAGISIEKRLKDAKKKQDQENKKKKKDDKEASASDNVTKPRVTKPRPSTVRKPLPTKASDKIKSAETVHESDDDDDNDNDDNEEGEITEPKAPAPPMKKAVTEKRNPSLAKRDVSATSNTSVPAAAATSKPKATATPQETPRSRPAKNTAPGSQMSPRKDTRPKVPSPLGTTKPRNATDQSDKPVRPAAALTSTRPTVAASKAPPQPKSVIKGPRAATASQAQRPAPVIKKRPLEAVSRGSDVSTKPAKLGANTTPKAATSTVSTKVASDASASTRPSNESISKRQIPVAPPEKPKTGGAVKNVDKALKRKANDISSGPQDDNAAPGAKHRKTNSSSAHSVDQTASSLTSMTTAPTASPDPSSPRSASQHQPSPLTSSTDVIQMFLNDSEASPKTQSTWEAALDKAARFRTQLYPAYVRLYDKLESMAPDEVSEDDRRTLFKMHGKLRALKKDIYDAVG